MNDIIDKAVATRERAVIVIGALMVVFTGGMFVLLTFVPWLLFAFILAVVGVFVAYRLGQQVAEREFEAFIYDMMGEFDDENDW